MAGAVSLALPLELFYKNTHDAYPTKWTYIEDELFIPMRPNLKKDIGDCVSTLLGFCDKILTMETI